MVNIIILFTNALVNTFICQSCEYECTSGKETDITIGKFQCTMQLCDECYITLKKETIPYDNSVTA